MIAPVDKEVWLAERKKNFECTCDTCWEYHRWQGVYPGMCMNPETCRGYSHCPRAISCCE